MLMVHSGMAAMTGAGLETDRYFGADIVLDFAGVKNAGVPFYRVDGVTYASAAAAGFTGTGTFNASGYTPTGTQSLTKTISLPGDFIVHSRFVKPPSSGIYLLWQNRGGFGWEVYQSANATRVNPTGADSSTAATSVSFGRALGLSKSSFDGGAVATRGSYTPPGTSVFRVGNSDALDVPWSAAIRLLTIHNRTLSDAEIAGLSQ